MVRIRTIIAGFLCLTLSILCQAQIGPIKQQTLRDLNADWWPVRRNAFEHLAAVPDGVNQPDVQSLLIQLRDREDKAANAADPAPDLFEDDDYLAYDEQLTAMVQQVALKTENPAAWRALVYMRYNGDSVYGNWLASHRESLPFLMQQLKSPYAPQRMNAVYVIANMLAKSKVNSLFPPSQYQSIKRQIRAMAMRGNPAVRQSAMQGLGLTKDAEDAAFLETLAAECKEPYTRKFALDAAQEIRNANP